DAADASRLYGDETDDPLLRLAFALLFEDHHRARLDLERRSREELDLRERICRGLDPIALSELGVDRQRRPGRERRRMRAYVASLLLAAADRLGGARSLVGPEVARRRDGDGEEEEIAQADHGAGRSTGKRTEAITPSWPSIAL